MKTITNFRALIRGVENFNEALDILTDAGLSKGRAILLAAERCPKLYNAWMRKRSAEGDRPQRGSSIMSHFRIIGG